jgi:hypothetical protein
MIKFQALEVCMYVYILRLTTHMHSAVTVKKTGESLSRTKYSLS